MDGVWSLGGQVCDRLGWLNIRGDGSVSYSLVARYFGASARCVGV